MQVTRRLSTVVLALAALCALALPAVASAKKKVTLPEITRVTPMRVVVGSKVTIRGKNFKASKKATTVVFRASNGRSAFAKPMSASRTKLLVKVPAAVSRLVGTSSKRFKIRVLSGKFSKFTSRRLSPVVVGKGKLKTTVGVVPGKDGVLPACPTTGDYDDDGLNGTREIQIKTDPCKKDTDLDGVSDGFEYRSARDLNDDEYQEPNKYLPYPGSRPYPNALDPGDAGRDHDGDSLSLATEYALWKYTKQPTFDVDAMSSPGTPAQMLTYSAGEQYSVSTRDGSGRRGPSLPSAGYAKEADFLAWASANGYRTLDLFDGAPWSALPATNSYGLLDFDRSGGETPGEQLYYDLDHNGVLSDEERDEDADGLTNFDENTGRLTSAYWDGCYGETPFGIVYADPSPVDPDSDGDGVRDGADDQDHDDIPNVLEISRQAASHKNDRKAAKDCEASELHAKNFEVRGGPLPNGALTVEFHQSFGDTDVPQMTADGSALNAGSVTVATTRPGGAGVDEWQSITIDGNPTAGGFTLSFNGKTTARIPYNATAEQVQTELEALFPTLDNVNHPNAYGRVNPYNPCLPAAWSRSCTRHPGLGGGNAATFDNSINWLSLN